MSLTLYDEFAGWGGSSQGAAAVPGVELVLAANHNELAIDVHSMNFPTADHYLGDIAKADITKFPRADIFWASPACPAWSNARGVRRDFDRSTQGVLWDEEVGPVDPNAARSRALMEEVPRYLGAMKRRGKPVLAGVVENVVECRKWDQWGRWLGEIQALGYRTRVIAFNSMHAKASRTRRAPQSRDRLYVAYWLDSLGRDPDWDRWLRPEAYCPSCDETVAAVQVFKKPGVDMGRYGRYGQYWFRCPRVSCRNRIVEPEVLPALVAIDWDLPPGQKIGERVNAKGHPDPLEPATLARIEAGLREHVFPLLSPAGGTWRDSATSTAEPMPTRTTRETDGLVVPPLLVPVEGRDGKRAVTVLEALRTQTGRNETGLVLPPFLALLRSGRPRTIGLDEPLATIVADGSNHALVMPFLAVLRGGGSKHTTRASTDPLATFSAQGQHHALVQPPDGGVPLESLLVSYYSNGKARPLSEPIGTLTAKDRYGLVGVDVELPRVEDCTFRMLTPEEIAAGMAFAPDYKVKGSKRDRVRGFGNAVTPPVAEVLVSALVEAITGESLGSAA